MARKIDSLTVHLGATKSQHTHEHDQEFLKQLARRKQSSRQSGNMFRRSFSGR